MDSGIARNTALIIYPSYIKKELLKKAVNDGLVINDKKRGKDQISLNLNNSIDVTDDATDEDKFSHMLQSSEILSEIEEFEYKKVYRHFCYFKIDNVPVEKIRELVQNQRVNVFDKRKTELVDEFDKPTIYSVGDQIYIKFSYCLNDESSSMIKYVIIAIIDKNEDLLEIRFDRVGIAYKNSYNYYKDKMAEILRYFREELGVVVENIDFKAVVDYIKSEKDDITIIAQQMNRNGSTAYLEAYDEEEITIPILGELERFIAQQENLFNKNEDTKAIRDKLQDFLREIEVKSDMPKVKIRMAGSNIKFGITHNYKNTEYSMFMLSGELVGEETMGSVKDYLMQCYKELRTAVSADSVSEEEM